MVPDIRMVVLATEGAATDVDDDFSGDEKQDTEVRLHSLEIEQQIIHILETNAIFFYSKSCYSESC